MKLVTVKHEALYALACGYTSCSMSVQGYKMSWWLDPSFILLKNQVSMGKKNTMLDVYTDMDWVRGWFTSFDVHENYQSTEGWIQRHQENQSEKMKERASQFCQNFIVATIVHSSLYGPHVLICMPDNVGAPNETTDVDLGNLLLAYSRHMRLGLVVSMDPRILSRSLMAVGGLLSSPSSSDPLTHHQTS